MKEKAAKKCAHCYQSSRAKGDRYMSSNGYVIVKTPLGMKAEHRVVMERHLGRQLVKGEMVHHVNGDRWDNRVENLELCAHFQPPGQRIRDKLAWAREILARYENEEELL